jgi:hypothetical protein
MLLTSGSNKFFVSHHNFSLDDIQTISGTDSNHREFIPGIETATHFIHCQRLECMELCLHFRVRLHGMVFMHRDNIFT